MIGQLIEAELLQRPGDDLSDLGLVQFGTPQTERDILTNGRHDDLRIGIGEAKADPLAHIAALAGRRESIDGDRAGGGHHESVE